MTDDDISNIVQTLLNKEEIDPSIARQLMVVITLYTRSELHDQQLRCEKNHNTLTALIQIQTENISNLSAIVEQHEEYIRTHPSIVYLLRFRTKETIATIVFLILVLSLWYVSGIRQPILEFFGLPIF